MLPPSGKGEIQRTVEETTNADAEKRKAEQDNASTDIAAAIIALRDAQQTQTSHEDSNDQKNRTINKVTLGLVFLTVIFTGLSWLSFREQVGEMKRAYAPLKDSADAAKSAADIAERTLRISQAAILTFADWETKNIEAGKTPYFRVKILNVGHTTAIITNDSVRLTITDELSAPTYTESPTNIIIAPNGGHYMEADFSTVTPLTSYARKLVTA